MIKIKNGYENVLINKSANPCDSCKNFSICKFHQIIFDSLETFKFYSWMKTESDVKEAINKLFSISEGCKFYETKTS